MGPVSRSPNRLRVWVAAAGFTAGVALLAGLLVARGRTQPVAGDYLGALGQALRPPAGAGGPRLSIFPTPDGCAPVPWYASAFREPCPTLTPAERRRRILAIRNEAQRAVDERQDPEAMHALALIDLLGPGPVEKQLDRAISSLRTAAALSDQPAPILADLVSAYLIRAERAHTPRDLLAAIEVADGALEHDAGNARARFNLALALQRFGLVDESAEVWRSYLRANPGSAWAREARRQLDQMLGAPAEPAAPVAEAPVEAYTDFAAADPERAREVGWCRVLGAWADDVLAGDGTGAERDLRRAETLGGALERRRGGDASLADGVRAVRAQRSRTALQRLAEAQRAYSTGCEFERRVEFGAAENAFARAAGSAGASAPLEAWARLHHAAAVMHGRNRKQGEELFRALAARVDSVRYPAQAGFAHQFLSAALMRGDTYEVGVAEATRARRLFATAGERENEGAALEALSTGTVQLRDLDGGYALAAAGLERLGRYRASYRLHNLLGWIASVADDDGFPRAALRVQDECVRVAQRTGVDVYVAEAYLARARLYATGGAFPRALADIDSARAPMARAQEVDPTVRGWMVARRQMAEAPTRMSSDPARAAAALDSATGFFADTMGTNLVALPAIVDGAHARLAAGQTARGIALLDRGLRILERRRDLIRMEPRRAAVFDEARALVDQAAMSMLAKGRPVDALRYLDRGRATLAAVGPGSNDGGGSGDGGRSGEVTLEYGMVGDTLLAWTLFAGRTDVYRAVLDTAALARTTDRLLRGMEAAAGEAELRQMLSELYEWLLRPLEARLGLPGTPVVVIADGRLGSIPFAALFDARRGRFLVQDHLLRHAASLRDAARPARPAPLDAPSLFVLDPAFDPRENPELTRLPESPAETRAMVSPYPRVAVLRDTAATAAALRSALPHAGMLYYGGHAVFDDARPERSYLVLAPGSGTGTAPTLAAGEIAQMDLRNLGLVVLAACRTVRTGPGRADGFSGLAGAFLAAGAGGAVGSLWEVDDRLTRPLMMEFHRAYRAAPDGARALRAAQLRLLASGDPALRSPAAWAGFRYVGS